jgi:CBS domain-containing protein
MTDVAFFCHANERVVDCMREMSLHQVRRIPIVDDDNRVVGIVSLADLARHASEYADGDEQRAVADMVCAVSEPSSPTHR